MNRYLVRRYGDPCRTCRFSWQITDDHCRQLVERAPQTVAAQVRGRSGWESLPDLDWDVGAYVAHLGDTIRVWAARVAGTALGPRRPVVPYDEARLGEALGYSSMPIEAALWSLERAVLDWRAAERLAAKADIRLDHPEQGDVSLSGVRHILAHEVHHHSGDIASILGGSPDRRS